MENQPMISKQFERRGLKAEIVKLECGNSGFESVNDRHHDAPLIFGQLIIRLN
jgi:hypothetical protein